MKIHLLLVKASLLVSLPGMAQSFAVTGLLPVRNALAVPRATNVAVFFSQALAPSSLGALHVFSSQRGGRLAGAASIAGNTLGFDPFQEFKPGEVLQATITNAAQSSGGAFLRTAQVVQFNAAVQGGTAQFGGGSEVLAANTPGGVAAADVDGDGDLDMLAANSGSNSVSVRLNNGRGSFSGQTNVPVGSNPLGVTAADVDGDGDLDFLAANSSSASVSVRLNDGAGVFSVPSTGTVAIGNNPQMVVVADVDGDGDGDLLAVNYVFTPNGTVTVRLNNGTGVFSGGSTVSVDSGPLGLTVGDIDNDGDLDLLTANFFNGTVSVRRNDGNGLFSGTADLMVGRGAQSVAAADVDNDGDLDVVVADNSSPGVVNVRFNDGLGNFGGGSDVPAGFSPTSVALADLDGDGDLDLLASSYNSSAVSVRINTGSGQFTTGSNPVVGGRPQTLALGDVDGDGDIDFMSAVGITGAAGAVSVRFNNGTGAALASAPAQLNGLALALFPNPAHATATVRLPAVPGATHATLALLDALGRAVRTQVVHLPASGATTEVPLAGLAPGLYRLWVQAGEQQTSRPLSVE